MVRGIISDADAQATAAAGGSRSRRSTSTDYQITPTLVQVVEVIRAANDLERASTGKHGRKRCRRLVKSDPGERVSRCR